MHQNEKQMRDAYEAYGRSDLADLTANWADDIVWHIKGSTPLAGDYRGAEKILGFLAETTKLADSPFALDVQKIFADDEIGIALCRAKGTIAGKPFDTLVTHVHRLVDGKVTESWFLSDDAVEMDAAQVKAFKLVPASV